MSDQKEQSITERDALEWVRRKLAGSGEVTREQADAAVESLARGEVPDASISGSLEQELAAEIKIDRDDLMQKVKAMEGVDNTGDLLVWTIDKMLAPLLRKHQDAILHLAREIDELKGESDS